MKRLERTPFWKRWFYSRTAVVLFVILFVVLGRATFYALLHLKEVSEREKSYQEELALVTTRDQELSADIERLRTDKGKREEILERFNVAQSGENVVIILDQEEIPATTTVSAKKKSFFSRFLFWK